MLVAADEEFESDNNGHDYNINTKLPNYYSNLPDVNNVVYHSRSAAILPTTTTMLVVWDAICGTNTSSTTTADQLFVSQNSSTGKTETDGVDDAFAIQLSNGSYYCKDI